MAQLEGMGFPVIRCQKALLATGNKDPEAAMEWLFAHMEDPGALSTTPRFTNHSSNAVADIDSPIQATKAASPGPEPSADQISMLGDMGFTPAQARKALRETVSWLVINKYLCEMI